MHKKMAVITVMVLIAATTVGALSVWAAGPLVQASSSSPFSPACNGAPQSGVVYPNSEVEPWLAVNPANSSNIVGAWQQDRWSTGGANGLVAGVSIDGGTTWSQVVIPNITRCSGASDYERASDPWVTFAPNGDLYHISLSFNDSNTNNGVLVSKSIDGGSTWSNPVTLLRDTAPTMFNDKESITADPGNANYVYAIWDRLVFPKEQASASAALHALGYRGPTWFSRTTDGGATWEPARMIYDPGEVNQTIGNQIVVRPNGDLVNVMDLIYNFKNAHKVRGLNVAILRSTDKGVTWSGPIIIDKLRTIGVTEPTSGQPVRTGDIIPEIAVGPEGNLYVVWQDARFNGYDEVAFSMSTDGGITWTPTIKISQSPGGVQAFTPSVRVRADGRVGVTYYDFRNNNGVGGTDYFLVTCSSNCASAGSWIETRVTDSSFDMRNAPVARGYFTGDYEGLASDGNDFLAFFSQPSGSDSASIFFWRTP